MNLTVSLTDEMLKQIAERAAEIVLERQADTNGDGWLRGADKIAAYIDAPKSRVFALSSAGRIPTQKDGSALIARKSDLDRWIESGGGKRP